MPRPSTRPTSSASNAARYDPISNTNSTANAFLGGGTKSWMRTGPNNTPTQSSPTSVARRRRSDLPSTCAPSDGRPADPKNPMPHRPQGLQPVQSNSKTDDSVLPSPALTNEPSPSASTRHVSPNMPSADSQAASAEATGRSEAYFESINASNTNTSQNAIEPTPNQQIPAPSPSIAGQSELPPAQTETGANRLPAESRNSPRGPIASPLLGRGDKRRQNPDQDGAQSEQPLKRNRLSMGSASQVAGQQNAGVTTMEKYVQALDRRIAESQPLERSTEQPRYNYLRDACVANDGFYVVLHQVFCIWSFSDDFDQQMLPSMSQAEISKAFRLLSQILRSNDTLSRDHLSWFARFPDLCDGEAAGSLRATHLHVVDGFLAALVNKWQQLLKDVQRRKYPFLAYEVLHVLGCKSQVLCGSLFTVSRRILEVPDKFCIELNSLFAQEYEQELRSDPNAASALLEQVAKYKSLVSQACSRAPQHGRRRQPTTTPASPAQAPSQAPSQAPAQGGSSEVRPGTNAPPPTHASPPIPNASTAPFDMTARIRNAGPQPQPQQQPQQQQQEQLQWAGTVQRPRQTQQNNDTQHAQPQINGQASPVQARAPAPAPVRVPSYHQTGPQYDHLSRRSMSGGALSPSMVLPSQSLSPFQQQAGPQQPPQYPEPGVQNQSGQAAWPNSLTHPTWNGYPYGQPSHPVPGQQMAASPHAQFPNALPGHVQPLYPQHHQQRSPSLPSSFHNNPHTSQQMQSIPPQTQCQCSSASMPLNGSLSHGSTGAVLANPSTSHHNHQLPRHSVPQPRIRQIPENEFPLTPYDWTSVEMAAHLPQLRSPLRRPAQGVSGPHLQYVNGWFWKPTKMEPRIGKLTFYCTISTLDMQRLVTRGKDPSGLSVRYYAEGSRRYRLRCCRLPSHAQISETGWVTTETSWPQEMYLFVNKKPLDLPRKQHFHNDLAVELTDHLREGNNEFTICLPPNNCNLHPTSSFFLAMESIHTTSLANARLEVMEKNPRVRAAAIEAEIARRLKPDDSDDVIVDDNTIVVSLADPFSSVMCEVPVRGLACRHLECFDLDIWLNTRRGKSKHATTTEPSLVDGWKCPICDGDARPSSLRVDEFFINVRAMLLADGQKNIKKIKVSLNGSWVPVAEPDDDDDDEEAFGAPAAPAGLSSGISRQPSNQPEKPLSSRAPVNVIEIDGD